MDYTQSTTLEEMESLPRGHKPSHGKLGAFAELPDKRGITDGYIWQRSGKRIVRGIGRFGLRARDFEAEVVFRNEQTSPRVEVPRVIIKSMELVDAGHISANDLAIWFRLFAQARLKGMQRETSTIRLADLCKYLGIRSIARVKASLVRLSGASITLHVNLEGSRRRFAMPMIERLDDGLAYACGTDEIVFALPETLRAVVLESRDYAWIELNALSRFSSRFTAGIYLRLCYEAGKHWRYRETLDVSKAEFRDLMGLSEDTQTSVLEAAIFRVLDDLVNIDGVRCRFPINVNVDEDRIYIEVGSAARKLREVKPQTISNEAAERICRAVRSNNRADLLLYPTLTRMRQAATLLETKTWHIFDAWRTDILGAKLYPNDQFVGLTGRAFLELIRSTDSDDVFESWLDKRDLSDVGVRRYVEVVEHTTGVKAPVVRVEAVCLDLPRHLIRNHGVAIYDDPLPPEPSFFAEVDDDEIDF